VVQVTGVRANNEGIYPGSPITVHVGTTIASCHSNPFGECLLTISNPPIGSDSIYATYAGYGTSYQSGRRTWWSNRDPSSGCEGRCAKTSTAHVRISHNNPHHLKDR